MTKTSTQPRTRTWSVPTSPRNPYKLQNELALIAEFDGLPWNTATQVLFAGRLANSDFYQGSVSANHPDFAARDRVNRAPRTFGFVRLGRSNPLKITNAGRELIAGRELQDLFLRQLLKWQYPSPNHSDPDYRDLFQIKPFLEVLRLVQNNDGLSKIELAIFGVALTDFNQYEQVQQELRQFRVERDAIPLAIDRKRFVNQYFVERYRDVYSEDIQNGRTGQREASGNRNNADSMVQTKMRNALDYADAAIRYFRATGLFTISARMYRLRILPERFPEVDEILKNTLREPEAYDDVDAFYAYLGDPLLPKLPSDAVDVLRTRVAVLFNSLPGNVRSESGLTSAQIQQMQDPIALKSEYRRLVALAEADATKQQQEALRDDKAVDEVMDMFSQIRTNQVPDRPLYFEWNIWRAMSVLNDGDIKNNFQMDRFGQPLASAPGRGSDIECEYKQFHLAVEVTLSYGARQYDTEGEPVQRHVGKLQKERKDSGDTRPVYGLFIAEKLHDSVITHFFALHRIPTREFGGAVSIVPLSLEDFAQMLQSAETNLPITSLSLYDFFTESKRMALEAEDEEQWHSAVRDLSHRWLALSN